MGQEVIGDFLQTHGITQEKFLWAHKILLSRAMTFYREGWDLNLRPNLDSGSAEARLK